MYRYRIKHYIKGKCVNIFVQYADTNNEVIGQLSDEYKEGVFRIEKKFNVKRNGRK